MFLFGGFGSLALSSARAAEEPVKYLVIVNEHEDPALASVLLARSFEDYGVIVNVGVGQGKTERIARTSIVKLIPVPNLAGDFVYPQQFAQIKDALDGFSRLLETYPHFRAGLLPLGSELKTIVDSGARGFVREGGQWQEKAAMVATTDHSPTETILTTSGKEYREARIKAVEPDGLLLSHEGGVAKVLFTDLAKEIQEQHGYDPAAATAFREARRTAPTSPLPEAGSMTPGSVAAATGTGTSWIPATAEEVAACSLFIEVSKGISEAGEEGNGWNGTGFLCNVDGVTYVYSNAHNFDGAREFRIFDQAGKEYSEFVSVEIAGDGQAHWLDAKRGGDMVRLRLPVYEERALSLDSRQVDDTFVDRRILITGNTKGRGEITKLEGSITGVEPHHILVHNATTQSGNSGSPIVDLETWTVIGILTWGGYNDENPLMRLWSREAEEVREGINRGAGLAGVRFVPTSFDTLYRQRLVMAMLRRNTRLLGLLDTLIPTKGGLFVDLDKVVMGGYTVNDLLKESPDHIVVRELRELDKLLTEKGKSNIGVSNHDMLKLYVASYGKCLREISNHRIAIENSDAATFFMKCQIDHARLLPISRAYELVLDDSLEWYNRQLGTRGDALPLGERIRLPRMESGLEALGIKE
ncbi:MAG: serine protease [Verrucomicrobiales bacterium]